MTTKTIQVLWVVKSGTNDPSLLENGVKSQRFYFPASLLLIEVISSGNLMIDGFQNYGQHPSCVEDERARGMFLPFLSLQKTKSIQTRLESTRLLLFLPLLFLCVFSRKINGWLNRLVVTDPAGWTLGRRIRALVSNKPIGRWGSVFLKHKERSVSKEI